MSASLNRPIASSAMPMMNRIRLKNERTLVRKISRSCGSTAVGAVLDSPRRSRSAASAVLNPRAVAAPSVVSVVLMPARS